MLTITLPILTLIVIVSVVLFMFLNTIWFLVSLFKNESKFAEDMSRMVHEQNEEWGNTIEIGQQGLDGWKKSVERNSRFEESIKKAESLFDEVSKKERIMRSLNADLLKYIDSKGLSPTFTKDEEGFYHFVPEERL
jgi:hypothetical protein